ncbi:MAG: tyrosine-type recombinase/integrase [Candidatus Hodarchaeales archaeon]
MFKFKKNHFIALLGTKEIVRKNGVKYTIRNNRQRFFFPDEWQAFYDALKPKQKITFNFLINTGARIMEVQNIKVADVDFDRGNIVLRVTKRVVNRPKIQKKGIRTIRVLTISDKFTKYLRKIIRQYDLQEDDYFPILSTPAANIAMKKALRKIGIQDWQMFSLHNVRKTLETWLLALGVDNFKLVKHFGHSLNVALKHYVSPDLFSYEDKKMMRDIIGNLYEGS